jgi:hypothetical protein
MKLRLDLLEHLTAEESVHRFKPEPLLSKTGVGNLRPATPEERKQEEARSETLIERLKQRAAACGRKNAGKSSPSPNS